MHRRRFLADSVRLALGSSAASLLSGAFPRTVLADIKLTEFDEREARTLTVLTRAMFPHRALDDRYYFAVVEQLDRGAAASADTLEMLRSGIAQLDAAAERAWIDVPVDDKLRVMEELQTEPFFGAILNQTIDVLYRNRDVWKLLGYEGSSIEYGGYLNRGFNDIDWLSE
jgi:hypothetical protein